MNKCVYLTAITNKKYFKGVVGLINSFKLVNNKFPLVVMVPSFELKESLLNFLKIEENDSFFVICKNNIELNENMIKNKKFSHWKETFYKIAATNCTEFEKVLLIDSDMLVLKNLDHLFEKPEFSACNSGNAKMGGFHHLNSGLLLIKPSNQLYEKLVRQIPTTISERTKKNLDTGDQDVFRDCLPNWKYQNELHLDEGYNLFWSHIPYYLKENSRDNIFVIHFVGSKKPFNFSIFDYVKAIFSNFNFFQIRLLNMYIKLCKGVRK